jgi:Holliday junction resolvase
MSKINSRAKGARGERQWRDQIREAGWQAERGQQFAGGSWSPDVRTNMPFHFEVKCVEKLNMDSAINQATRDSAQGHKPWAVAHKRNHGEWRVTISAKTFFDLCRKAGL